MMIGAQFLTLLLSPAATILLNICLATAGRQHWKKKLGTVKQTKP